MLALVYARSNTPISLDLRRPKLKIAADVVLGRRKRAESTPRTFCSFDEISPEALELVEGCANLSLTCSFISDFAFLTKLP